MQPVWPERVLIAEWIPIDELDRFVGLDQRIKIVWWRFDDVDLASQQRVDRLLMVADRTPLDPVDLHHLAASKTRSRFRAGHILVVLHVYGLVAGLPFVRLEYERSGADELRQLRVGIAIGHALGHHEWHVRRRLAERGQNEAGRLLQLHREGLRVDRGQLGDEAHQLLAHAVLRTPTLDRGYAIFGGDRLAVVPGEARAQRECEGELVGRSLVLLDHLRLDFALRIHREQCVVDHVAVIAGDVGRSPDRIDDLQVGVHHDFEGGLRHRRQSGQGRCKSYCQRGSRFCPGTFHLGLRFCRDPATHGAATPVCR